MMTISFLSSLLPPRGPHCFSFTALMLPPQLHCFSSTALTLPPQLHCFSFTALMLPPQLHIGEQCTKSALHKQHAQAEVDRGLTLLPQLKSSAPVAARGGGRSTGSDYPRASPPTEALPSHAWTVGRLAFFLLLVQSFG